MRPTTPMAGRQCSAVIDGADRCGERPFRRQPLTAGVIAALVITAQARADDWFDTIRALHPHAAVAVTEDSNPLRVSTGEESDQYVTLEAGLSTEFEVSRQRFLIDGRIYEIDYDRLSEFDHNGGDARLLWKWLAGRLWEGELGYRFDQRLRDLAYQTVPEKDIRESHMLFGSADRWLDERWRLGLGAEWSDISFSSSPLDKEITGSSVTLDYISESGNSVGGEARYRVARYDQLPVRDYDEFTAGPTLRWKATPKLLVHARAGYLQRTHEHASDDDFSGPVARITAQWQATGKTQVEFKIWREISNLDDQVANYAEITGVALAPTWNISDKTVLRMQAAYEERDFQGMALAALAELGERTDEVSSVEIWLDWRPRPTIVVSLGGRAEQRTSDRPLEEYDYNYVQARVSIGL